MQLFIADLHLDPASPETIALALHFFNAAQGAQSLYILGDLFEYWLGDDAQDPKLSDITDALLRLSAGGTHIHLMHGNRDFLLGEHYAQRIGGTVHRPDLLQLEMGNERAVLLHGDTLCTDDAGYQQLRALVRDEQWQARFLALSVPERIKQAQQLRDKSRAAVAGKSMQIMDVNEAAVTRLFREQQCGLMIHGHTHRPEDHAGANGRRVVLGDWHGDHTHIGVFKDNVFRLVRYSRDTRLPSRG